MRLYTCKCLTFFMNYNIIKEKGDYMIYVVFKPSCKVAYCRREYPLTFEKLIARLRCRVYEYEHDIRTVGVDYQFFAEFGGFNDLRIAIAGPDEERPWPYTKFKSYKNDHDMNLWIDTHPHVRIYPIQTLEEYKKEKELCKKIN